MITISFYSPKKTRNIAKIKIASNRMAKLSTINFKLSTFNIKLSTFNFKLSTFNFKLSTIL